MKRTAFALSTVAALALMTSTASAQGQRSIYGGGNAEDSTYSGVMVPHILSVFEANDIGGYEWHGVTQGTGENIAQIEFNALGFAVGQSDAVVDAYNSGQPISVYFPNMGPECFHTITKDGTNFDAAITNGQPIYVGDELGGTAYSVKRLLTEGYGLDPTTINLQYSSPEDAANGGIGVFVQRPDPNASIYKKRADAGFSFSGIDSVDAELAGYSPLEVTVKDSGVAGSGVGASSTTFRTTCMTTVMFGHDVNKLEADGRDQRYLSRLVLPKLGNISDEDMLPPTEGSWLTSLVDQVNAAGAASTTAGGSLLQQLENIRN